MIAQVLNVAIGLLTTLLGYAIGRIWQKLSDQVPYRRTRKLWGALLDGELQIVVSRLDLFDPAGVVGGGDDQWIRNPVVSAEMNQTARAQVYLQEKEQRARVAEQARTAADQREAALLIKRNPGGQRLRRLPAAPSGPRRRAWISRSWTAGAGSTSPAPAAGRAAAG